jgi:hypothetical protein
MKKVFLFAFIITALLFSCKKEYTCVCSNFPADLGMTPQPTSLGKMTKKNATTSCKNIQKGYYLYPTVTCAIQ